MSYNYYAEADREAHYLFVAGFVSYCSCFRCEAEAEARYAEEQAEEDFRAWAAELDAATPEAIEEAAHWAWVVVEAAWEREFPAVGPFDDIPF
jgi:hypothetical protein